MKFPQIIQHLLRSSKEKIALIQAELLELTERLAQARGELLARQKMLESIIEELTERIPKRRLGEQEFFLRYSTASDEQIKRLRENVNKLESQQREKIAEVLKVRRFKEGLEKLRIEAKIQFIKEQEKLEQKELDEGATISFVRKL